MNVSLAAHLVLAGVGVMSARERVSVSDILWVITGTDMAIPLLLLLLLLVLLLVLVVVILL